MTKSKLIEALSVLSTALDNPQNPRRDLYIQCALFVGNSLFMDFLGYRTDSQIFANHEWS